jgi:enediyne biosynthesis protein E4
MTWQVAGKKWQRWKTSGGSYLASHDPREVLGLGRANRVERVEIRWPSGQVDKLGDLPLNIHLKVIEGKEIVKK